jgi:3'-phosphoadenosine 5'-phosphosulfate sulfotransferase (PAPS reductase)/FAD synthetase
MNIYENSDHLCAEIAKKNNGQDVILSFSMGKDSIAAYIQLKRYFKNVHLVFYWMIPDLSFQNESLKYYEDKLQTEIISVPSVHWYYHLKNLLYQRPDRIEIIDRWLMSGKLFIPTHDQIFTVVKESLKIPQSTYVATGVRQNDFLTRRLTVKKHGPENIKRKQFFPVYDWDIERVKKEIEQSSIKLPIDYEIWGRTFDGVEYIFLKGLKEHFPEDYQKVLFWFPFAELTFLRYKDFTI